MLALVVLARLLIGAGDALYTTAAMAWVADAAAPERRGRAMATLGMSLWLGLALGPQWAVWTHEHLGYDGVWLGGTVFALLAALLVWLVGPTPRAGRPGAGRSPRSKVPRGAILPAVAMVLICYGNAVFEAFGIVHLTDRGVSSGAGIGGAASVFTVVAVTTFLGRFAGGALSDKLGPRPVALAGDRRRRRRLLLLRRRLELRRRRGGRRPPRARPGARLPRAQPPRHPPGRRPRSAAPASASSSPPSTSPSRSARRSAASSSAPPRPAPPSGAPAPSASWRCR